MIKTMFLAGIVYWGNICPYTPTYNENMCCCRFVKAAKPNLFQRLLKKIHSYQGDHNGR